MASRTIIVKTDDLDGNDADETVHFGLDGYEYEIDLGLANSNRLREFLEPFVAAGRKLGKTSTGSTRRLVPVPKQRDAWLDRAAKASGMPSQSVYDPAGKEHRRKVREWTTSHGVAVRDRGRIAEAVIAAYDANDPTMLPGYAPPGGNGKAAPAPAAFQTA